MITPKSTEIIDFDGKWKRLIAALFEQAIEFFLPKLHPQIDYVKGYTSLNQELQKIVETPKKKGDKLRDLIFECHLKDGSVLPIFIHVEVESSAKVVFLKRMFRYYYRELDKTENPRIVSLAIYVGDKTPKNYNRYSNRFFGTFIFFKFNTFRVIDWIGREEELMKMKNPFALAVLASIYVLETRNDYEKRIAYKWKLARLLIERGYNEKVISLVFSFINNLMVLDESSQEKFKEKLIKTNKKMNMYFEPTAIDLDFADTMNKEFYGSTFREMEMKFKEEAIKRKEEETKRKEEETKRKEEELKRKLEETKREKTVLKLIQEEKWTLEKTADLVDISISQIKKILEKADKN